jgi:hypothetical protein
MPKARIVGRFPRQASDTLTLVAVALPEALATAMQYSTVAPGIIFGLGRAVDRIADDPARLGGDQRRGEHGIIVLGEVDAVARCCRWRHWLSASTVSTAAVLAPLVAVIVAPSEPAARLPRRWRSAERRRRRRSSGRAARPRPRTRSSLVVGGDLVEIGDLECRCRRRSCRYCWCRCRSWDAVTSKLSVPPWVAVPPDSWLAASATSIVALELLLT